MRSAKVIGEKPWKADHCVIPAKDIENGFSGNARAQFLVVIGLSDMSLSSDLAPLLYLLHQQLGYGHNPVISPVSPNVQHTAHFPVWCLFLLQRIERDRDYATFPSQPPNENVNSPAPIRSYNAAMQYAFAYVFSSLLSFYIMGNEFMHDFWPVVVVLAVLPLGAFYWTLWYLRVMRELRE